MHSPQIKCKVFKVVEAGHLEMHEVLDHVTTNREAYKDLLCTLMLGETGAMHIRGVKYLLEPE